MRHAYFGLTSLLLGQLQHSLICKMQHICEMSVLLGLESGFTQIDLKICPFELEWGVVFVCFEKPFVLITHSCYLMKCRKRRMEEGGDQATDSK
jgi:hypothetical protein